jgi:hypothetical protein
MTADGKLDEAASLRKQAESYAPLAARMRETGAPPKTADEYQLQVPDALKETYDPAKDTMLGDFRAKAFEAGLTQKQFAAMSQAYMERLPQIAEALFNERFENGEKALRQVWKSDDQFRTGLRSAAQAVRGFDAGAFDGEGNITNPELKSLMNNPFFIRFAAHFGQQMQEDTSPGSDNLPTGSPYRTMTLQQLETHEAYLNSRHPDHATVSSMVRRAYHKQTGEPLNG